MSGIKLLISIIFFIGVIVPFQADAAVFYVDFQCADTLTCGNGTATTTSFDSLDSFTEVTRSAGDIAFVRRGVASTTSISDVTFTSDGTISNPIIISADYDNLWNDFASSTQTYTVAAATSTFYASASITDIAAGDWVYVENDCFETYNSTSLNQCEFAYEVSSVSGTALSFYLPYKGNQTGAGNELRVMPDNPQWNTTTGDFEINFATDDAWLIKGLHANGTDIEGTIEISNSDNIILFDVISFSPALNDGPIETENSYSLFIKKTRTSGYHAIDVGSASQGGGSSQLEIQDSFFDCLGTSATAACIEKDYAGGLFIENSEFSVTDGMNFMKISASSITQHEKNIYFKNVIIDLNGGDFESSRTPPSFIYFEDFNGTVGDNVRSIGDVPPLGISDVQVLTRSTTTVTRTGGGNTSISITPQSYISPVSHFSRLKLFEYPIYTDTTSKQYDVYFHSTSTAAWTADPTNKELWIECEYWAHETNATSTRKILKSTGTLPFTTDQTNWNALSVTCVPSQTGILYLRGWYAKTKEAGMNEFFVDGTPVIQ